MVGAGDIDCGNVGAGVVPNRLRRMTSDEGGELFGRQDATGEGAKQVLRLDDRVVLAEAGNLALDVMTGERIGGGNLLPGDLEVAADAVLGLGGFRPGDSAGQEVVLSPGSAAVDGGGIPDGGHRAEVLVPLPELNVLSLVAFQ